VGGSEFGGPAVPVPLSLEQANSRVSPNLFMNLADSLGVLVRFGSLKSTA